MIPPVTIEELTKAYAKVGNHKCPGLDGILNIALKAAIEAKPDTFFSMYTRCLWEEVFPDKCSHTAGKILERIIHGRLEEVTDRQLSNNQFGFRKDHLILDAINLVDKTKEATSGKGMAYYLVVALDSYNAFNSAKWNRIMEALEKMNVPGYLRKIVASS